MESVNIIIMSGVEDGLVVSFFKERDGYVQGDGWTISIGRREDNDLSLRNDTFSSRQHAQLHWRDNHWWLEDCTSVNGTFLENEADFFADVRIKGIVSIEPNKPFRIGRTWLKIQPTE